MKILNLVDGQPASPIVPMSTHYKETLRLGVPIIIGQLGIIVVNFADNIMVGHYNTLDLAAASYVNNLFNLAFIFGIGLSYGLTPLVSGCYKERDYDGCAIFFKASLLINSIAGFLMALFMSLLFLNISIFNPPAELLDKIHNYSFYQCLSLLVIMPFNSFKQFNDGITDTLTPMFVILASNILNIFGNYLLIFGHWGFPELGVEGAGIASFLSRLFALATFFLLFHYRAKYRKLYHGDFYSSFLPRKDFLMVYRLGLPVGLQMGVETASFSLSVIMMGWLGSTALASYQVAGAITTLGFMIYYGIGSAVCIRVGGFYGYTNWASVRPAVKAGFVIMSICVLLFILFLLTFQDTIGNLFTNNSEVVSMVALFCWPMILYQFGDALQILFANALRGVSDVKYLAKMAVICHFGLALPIGYLCGFIFDWGALGIWCGFPISLTTLGLLLWKRFNYYTYKWDRIHYIEYEETDEIPLKYHPDWVHKDHLVD